MDFKNTAPIMTSNLGSDLIGRGGPLGFAGSTASSGSGYGMQEQRAGGPLRQSSRPSS